VPGKPELVAEVDACDSSSPEVESREIAIRSDDYLDTEICNRRNPHKPREAASSLLAAEHSERVSD
jgi:hypothetical protein